MMKAGVPVITGSEGLLGVVTEVTVRILPKPQTARAVLLGFPTVESAGKCVADVIAATGVRNPESEQKSLSAQLESAILMSMRESCHADIAFLQHRDLCRENTTHSCADRTPIRAGWRVLVGKC